VIVPCIARASSCSALPHRGVSRRAITSQLLARVSHLSRALVACVVFSAAAAPVAAQPGALPPPVPPAINAKAFVLIDAATGTILAQQAADERFEPASLTKLMTAYLTFNAIRQKRLMPTLVVPISDRARKAEGSRMFIEQRIPVTVDELMRGMIIQSGNDASIALAEAIAGGEDAFASAMTREAQRLGMKSTSFMNSTGLPDPKHFSTANDLGRLAVAIIRDFPEFYGLYSQRDYTYNKIKQANRNRLLQLDPSVDGMKTGFTEAAGWCLVTSARRGERRLVSVVLGAPSESARISESQKLINYGFQFFDNFRLYSARQVVSSLAVFKGTARQVEAGFDSDLVVTLPAGSGSRVKADLESVQPLVAPVAAGQRVGTLKLTLDGRALAEYPVVALQPVEMANIFRRAWDSMRLMFN
jgi:serine-type D-Ala-D-Ala carboxypeptidase (penicillin-binding protein 5/6)